MGGSATSFAFRLCEASCSSAVSTAVAPWQPATVIFNHTALSWCIRRDARDSNPEDRCPDGRAWSSGHSLTQFPMAYMYAVRPARIVRHHESAFGPALPPPQCESLHMSRVTKLTPQKWSFLVKNGRFWDFISTRVLGPPGAPLTCPGHVRVAPGGPSTRIEMKSQKRLFFTSNGHF